MDNEQSGSNYEILRGFEDLKINSSREIYSADDKATAKDIQLRSIDKPPTIKKRSSLQINMRELEKYMKAQESQEQYVDLPLLKDYEFYQQALDMDQKTYLKLVTKMVEIARSNYKNNDLAEVFVNVENNDNKLKCAHIGEMQTSTEDVPDGPGFKVFQNGTFIQGNFTGDVSNSTSRHFLGDGPYFVGEWVPEKEDGYVIGVKQGVKISKTYDEDHE